MSQKNSMNASSRGHRAIILLSAGAVVVHLVVGWLDEGRITPFASGHGIVILPVFLWLVLLVWAIAEIWVSRVRSGILFAVLVVSLLGLALIR